MSAGADNYEARDGEIDPLAIDAKELPSGEWRVMRGGSAWSGPAWARAACRDDGSLDWGIEDLGFRVALPAVPELIER